MDKEAVKVKTEDIMDCCLEDLELLPRAYNCLKRAGIFIVTFDNIIWTKNACFNNETNFILESWK